MLLNNHFEDLSFSEGKIINISRVIDPGYTGVNHWHPFAEILLSLKEGNEVTLNFKKYRMKPNDFIISYPGDLHSINNVSKDSFLVIQFPMRLITVVHDFNRIQQLFYKSPFFKYDVYNAEHDKMIVTLKEIVNQASNEKIFNEALGYSLLLKFFTYLGQQCVTEELEETEETESAGYKSAKLMAEACLYITQNCAEPLTLEDVAHQIGISKSYFSHLFKDFTQMTFVDYLTKERIRRAETMFSGPKKKMIDIAFECGFTSVSSFNRTFKKIKGISPREFRTAMRQSITDKA